MRTLLIVFGLALAAVAAQPACAKTSQADREKVIELLATLSVANRWCSSEYKVDIESATDIAMEMDFDPNDASTKSKFSAAKSELENMMSEKGATASCAVLYEFFKPGGQTKSGLMMRK